MEEQMVTSVNNVCVEKGLAPIVVCGQILVETITLLESSCGQ